MKWIVEKLTGLWVKDIRWNIDNSASPHEENYLRLNCTKANSRLDWMPKLNLEQGLEWVIEWYKHILSDQKLLSELSINRKLL